MKRFIAVIMLCVYATISVAQKGSGVDPKDFIPAGVQATVTKNSVVISGKKIEYTAHTGYLDLKNDTGKMIAKSFLRITERMLRIPLKDQSHLFLMVGQDRLQYGCTWVRLGQDWLN